MAIKVGNKVRVKENIQNRRAAGLAFTEPMDKFRGRECIILKKYGCEITLDGIKGYVFHEDWLEKVDGGFKVGDVVVFKTIEEMALKYGMIDSDVKTRFTFTYAMREFCGRKAKIINIKNNGEVFLFFDDNKFTIYANNNFSFSLDMLNRCDDECQKEEEDGETTFDFGKATQDGLKLFSDYKYIGATESSVKHIIETAYNAKRNLRAIFRKHPNWDENQQAIIFSEEFETGINQNDLGNAMHWFIKQLYERFARDKKVDFDEDRYKLLTSRITFCKRHISDDYQCMPYVIEAMQRQIDELYDEYKKLTDKYNSISYSDETDCYLTINDRTELIRLKNFCYRVIEAKSNVINDEIMCHVANLNTFWKTNGKKGQKLSRFLMKVFKHYGIDDVKVMKSVVHNGRVEMKDFGYNYYFAMLGDAINPLHIKKYTVISINPLDYWTMSFGKNWSSCQTIDKLNVRQVNSSHYHGSSSSGTESYMLDDCTVLFYTVDEDYVGEMWKANKDRRMNFHVSKDGKFMIFGRLYPDGRDGGETGLGAQFRNTMQKVLAECIGENNLWKIEKGTVGDSAYTIGTNYPDYHKYEDTGVCYITGSEKQMLMIGRNPICPCCGETHDYMESVFCRDHHNMDVRKCERCGNQINEVSDAIFCEDNGCWYCCSECANDDDVYYCHDDESYHTIDQCYMDHYTSQYYHDLDSAIVIGRRFYYQCEGNMTRDGWVRTEDGHFTNTRHRAWGTY